MTYPLEKSRELNACNVIPAKAGTSLIKHRISGTRFPLLRE